MTNLSNCSKMIDSWVDFIKKENYKKLSKKYNSVIIDIKENIMCYIERDIMHYGHFDCYRVDLPIAPPKSDLVELSKLYPGLAFKVYTASWGGSYLQVQKASFWTKLFGYYQQKGK